MAAERILTRYLPPIAIAGLASASVLLLPPWQALAATAALMLASCAGWLAFKGRWLPLFLGAVILLPPLPLGLGDSGPHPAVLVAGIGVLVGLARLDSWRVEWSALNLAFGLLLVALTASLGFAAINSGTGVAAASAARLVLFSTGIYVYFAASQGPDQLSKRAVRNITRALFWIAIAAAAFGLVDFVFQLPAPAGFEPQFLWLDSGVYRRAQGLFYEASTLGNFCSFFLVMSAALLVEPRVRRIISTPVLISGIVLFSGAMFLSFSRASVLACGISLATLAVLERHRLRSRGLLVLAVLIPVAALIFFLTLPDVALGYWARFNQVFNNLLESPDRVLSGRLESWRILFGFMSEHPWQTFFGIGYKTLPYTEYLGRPIIADNMYLSLLIETGIAGLAALVALNVTILMVSWRALRRGSFHGRWMFCFWMGEVFQMLSGDILTYWRVLPVYFWVLAQAARDASQDN